MRGVRYLQYAKNHAVKYKGRRPGYNWDTCLVLNIRTFLGFVVFLFLLQCMIQRTILVMQKPMRSGVVVRNCLSSTTASSSLPSVANHDYPPAATLPPQDQGPGESNFSDGSEALFSMYLRRAREEDLEKAEGWKGYADGMLVFVSLRAPSRSFRIM
jgi:hypothetical protein